MGNRWDYSVPSVNVFTEILRVLRPGAHAFFFGGTRTYHRMAVNIEDAGFELRDTCAWMYGSGFPKSHDISKGVDKKLGAKRERGGTSNTNCSYFPGECEGHGRSSSDPLGVTRHSQPTLPATSDVRRWSGMGTALKPAWEPAILACKMVEGAIADNALKHGTGGIAIDASRVGVSGGPAGHSYEKTGLFGMGGKATIEPIPAGRWPANVLLSHAEGCVKRGEQDVTRPKLRKPLGVKAKNPSANSWSSPTLNVAPVKVGEVTEQVEVWTCVDDCPIRMLDEQSGQGSSPTPGFVKRSTLTPGSVGLAPRRESEFIGGFADHGGASRFFYQPKVGREERDRGLDEYEEVPKGADALRDGGRGGRAKNDHPTLKPIDLCRYFARLILPPLRADGKPRRILVPFSGSGSEMVGALQAGWDEVVGIELDPRHAEKARARIARGKIITNSK